MEMDAPVSTNARNGRSLAGRIGSLTTYTSIKALRDGLSDDEGVGV